MKRLVVLAVLALSLWAAAPASSVGDLIAAVRAGIRDGESDSALAKKLHKLKLSERLDWRVIEELESEGAGAKSVEEMSQLRDESRELQLPASPLPFEEPPQPGMEELKRVLGQARDLALDYTKSLPDFMCTQVVRRYASATGDWRLNDSLEVRLTYFGQKENYKLLKVNGRSAAADYSSVGGALSEGEFGSLLRLIFETKSQAKFHWGHWTRLRKRTAYVFTFKILAENSSYRLDFQRSRNTPRYSTIPGQRGSVWVDRETNRILRIYFEAENIQRNFPVRSSSSLVDYDFTSVGGRDFLLPLRADVRIESRYLLTRNLVEFRGYQKFAAETTISFDPK